MPVDYSLLNFKQPVGGVVANLPVVQAAPANQDINTLAGGLMQGLMQGQQIKESKQAMDMRAQQMDQSAQMFPSQLQQSQQAAQTGAIDLESKQQSRRDVAQAREAFNKSWDQGMSVMKKNDPAGYLALMQSQATYDKTLAETSDKMADTRIKANVAYTSMAATGADLAQHAAAAEKTNPGSGQKVYEQGLKMLPPALASSYPAQYNEETHLVLTKTGMDAQFKMADETAGKSLSSNQKDDKREAQLVEKQKAGTLNNSEQLELTRIQQRGDARARGMTGNPYDKMIIENDGKKLEALDKNDMAVDEAIQANKEALGYLAKTPAILLNPVANFVGLSNLDQKAQLLRAKLNDRVLTYKNIKDMGSQGFTNSDRQYVEMAKGGMGNYKGTLEEMLKADTKLQEHTKAANWLKKSEIYRKSSQYDQWVANNPEPEVVMQKPDGKGKYVDVLVPAGDIQKAKEEGWKYE